MYERSDIEGLINRTRDKGEDILQREDRKLAKISEGAIPPCNSQPSGGRLYLYIEIGASATREGNQTNNHPAGSADVRRNHDEIRIRCRNQEVRWRWILG